MVVLIVLSLGVKTLYVVCALCMFSCFKLGGPRGRVVKVADFSALDHSIISSMWVRASHGARIHM